ncbi:putative permease, YjgP/YjgQ family [Bartonella australis AUST/NH1]|uniref:Putative permease, YjgP/YjgQ family n=1 Tax=Bartonella australis (strain Aust/NH1) TaxID=1094489 RepID=M1NY00_BARAA|nr:LPS export ABC transporter permease LptF [Bartonella australis]AGF74352.1 putative permease, YjgP/YjgQ family [Bartonella australis AUST/NH1]
MRIIELYILRRVFILFIAVTAAAIGVGWTVQILARIDFLTINGQTLLTVLHFSSLLIPSVISPIIPFALMIAVTITLSTMNQDSELTGISACGLPKSTIGKPVLLLAIIASLVSFSIANFVVPRARLNMRQMMANTHSDLISLFIREGSFQELTRNLYIEIGEQRPNGTIGRLFIADQRNPQISTFYYATKGAVISNKNDKFLLLNDGEIERVNHQNDSVSIIEFSSYTFNLSEFTPNTKAPIIYPKDRPLSYLLRPDPNDPYYQREPLQYKAELHRRLTEWFYPIVFALIAVTAAGDARSHRQARISATFSAVTFSLLIYWIEYFLAEKIENDLFYVPLLYITLAGISIVLFFGLLTDHKITTAATLGNAVKIVFQKIKNRFKYKNSRYPPDKAS